ncbi:IDEAL domain-containing protein [Neobacillus sp. K501]
MKENGCKVCGSSEFFVMGSGEKRCKCGRTLNENKRPFLTEAELITKISLLKREIDRCLDERDQQGFHQYVLKLKVNQRRLKKRMQDSRSKRRFENQFLSQ